MLVALIEVVPPQMCIPPPFPSVATLLRMLQLSMLTVPPSIAKPAPCTSAAGLEPLLFYYSWARGEVGHDRGRTLSPVVAKFESTVQFVIVILPFQQINPPP